MFEKITLMKIIFFDFFLMFSQGIFYFLSYKNGKTYWSISACNATYIKISTKKYHYKEIFFVKHGLKILEH